MKMRYIITTLGLCLCVHTAADATTKKKVYVKLVEAYSKKSTSTETPTETGTHFVIRWENDQYPESFFWRGQSGWLSCKIQKAHKAKGKSKNPIYVLQDVAGDEIHKGDTLMLSPFTGGRFPIPAEIPANAKNKLYFQTGGSAWQSFTVSKIAKR